MNIDITKKVELSYIGEAWKECYLEFRMPSYSDLKDFPTKVDEGEEKAAIEAGIKRIKELFVSGKAVSGGEKVDVKSDDLADFPIEIITKCFKLISGEPDPKA